MAEMSEIVHSSEWGATNRLAARAIRPWLRTLRRVRRLHESSVTRRDRKDWEHMRLLLAFSLSPDSNCIDVGANQGKFCRNLYASHPEDDTSLTSPSRICTNGWWLASLRLMCGVPPFPIGRGETHSLT